MLKFLCLISHSLGNHLEPLFIPLVNLSHSRSISLNRTFLTNNGIRGLLVVTMVGLVSTIITIPFRVSSTNLNLYIKDKNTLQEIINHFLFTNSPTMIDLFPNSPFFSTRLHFFCCLKVVIILGWFI